MRALNRILLSYDHEHCCLSQTFLCRRPLPIRSRLPASPMRRWRSNLSIEKLYMTRQVGAADWSPDGKQIVFVSNISGRNNLWLVPAESGWPAQLTVSDQRQTAPAWSPDGKWIAYQSDYDGDEQWDIFHGFAEDRTGRQPDQYARDRGDESDLVPGRALPGLYGEAENFVGRSRSISTTW